LGTVRTTNEPIPVVSSEGGEPTFAIQVVRLAGQLSGTLQADRAGIGRVFVGNEQRPGGITGTIEAPLGSIGAILSAGEIGTATARATIRAGDSIGQIRTVSPDAPNTLRAVPINAAVAAGVRYNPFDLGNDEPLAPQLGAVGLIETGDKLSGFVEALNLGTPVLLNGLNVTGVDGRTGITCRGKIEAIVNIAWNLDRADIIGKQISGSIAFGNQVKGSIIAYGVPTEEEPLLGTISTVIIGRTPGELLPPSIRDVYPSGFVGTDAKPIDRSPYRFISPTEFVARTDDEIWFTPSSTPDAGAQDGVIFATREIEYLEISRVSQSWRVGDNAFVKANRPRIETPYIKGLRIDELVSGVLWSGVLNYETTAEGIPVRGPDGSLQAVADQLGDNYTFVTQGRIGCVGPGSDVYYGGLAGSDRQPVLEFTGDVLGELHLPEVPPAMTVRIAGKLGAGFSPEDGVERDGECLPPGVSFDPNSSVDLWPTFAGASGNNAPYEISPRFRDARVERDAMGTFQLGIEPALARHGAVRIAAPDGLRGQVIIHRGVAGDALTQDVSRLKGEVWVGDGAASPSYRILSQYDPSSPDGFLPLYDARATELGGGAVGLAPFALHARQCMPPSLPSPGSAFSLDGLARQPADSRPPIPVRVAFYGPVAPAATEQWVRIEWLANANSPAAEWIDATSRFTQSLSVHNRDIVLNATSVLENLPQFGRYRVWLADDAACDDTLFAPLLFADRSVPLYFFRLLCMAGGEPNPADVAGGDPSGPDGVVDGTDFIAFINSFAIGDASVDPLADVTGDVEPGTGYPIGDGTIDGSDFIAFINAFSAGCES